MRAGRTVAPDESELGRDLTKGNFVSVQLQTETLCWCQEIKPQEFTVKSNTPLWIASPHPHPPNGSLTFPVAPLSTTSCRRGWSSRVSTRVQVTDNSWELHAWSSDVPCPSIVPPFPLRNLRPVSQFATATAADSFSHACVCAKGPQRFALCNCNGPTLNIQQLSSAASRTLL